jgi:subtilisin family serine protease/Tol biopolymer transport system component
MARAGDEPVEALVVLDAAPPLPSRATPGQVRTALTATAADTQRPVADLVRAHGGRVLNSFWLQNMLLVEAPPRTLQRLAAAPSVDRLIPNLRVDAPEPDAQRRVLQVDEDGATWGLRRIGADRVHDELGVTGEGVRIAVLDTGVDITHPDLAGRMVTDDPSDPAYPGGWIAFDAAGLPVPSTPHDSAFHGTHVAGTALGGDASGVRIGVAPGAELMAAQVLSGGSGTLAQLIAGLQWAMSPTDVNGDPAGAPAHVINLSLGSCTVVQELIEPVRRLRAAGIFLSVAVGNDDPFTCPSCGAYGAASPANIYEAVAVGATDVADDVADLSCGEVQQRTSWPAPPADWPERFVKPDLSAPGVDVLSASLFGGYLRLSGTSMAAPHVAGAAALIRQADPDMSVDEAVAALAVTAFFDDRYGPERPNPRFGWGRIDAYEAVAYARLRSGIRGVVTDATTGEPLAGVVLTRTDNGHTVVTDAAGRFQLRMPPGTHEVELSRFGYETVRRPVEVPDGAFTDLTVALPLAPRGTVAGTVTYQGSAVPGVTVRVRDVPETFEAVTDHQGRYRLTEVPVGVYEVEAEMYDGALSAPATVTVTAGGTATADLELPDAPATQRVSLSTAFAQGNGASQWASISGDGRYVAFGSLADNLAGPAANGEWDVFVHDRVTGTTELVSVAYDGGPADGFSLSPRLSADGRYVGFNSNATNLVEGGTPVTDAYVRDLREGVTELVSVAYDGGPADGPSGAPVLSADGRFAAFSSDATNLVPDDTNGVSDVFVRDRVTGTTERISTAFGGGDADGLSIDPSISADGRYVAFTSVASNLVEGGYDGPRAVYVHDRQTGVTRRVPVPGEGDSGSPVLSGDGRTVVFDHALTTFALRQVYAYDLDTGKLELITVSHDGAGMADNLVSAGVPNYDGTLVAFSALAANLVPGDTNGADDIFVRDRRTGTTIRVTAGIDGGEADDRSALPVLSADGRYVAFQSHASNLVRHDTNGLMDVFVHDLQADRPQARFAVWDVRVQPDPARPRQPVTVQAKIRNVGDATGTYEAVLRVDGEVVATATHELRPGAHRLVRFHIRPTDVGDHLVAVGPVTVRLTVRG